MASTSRSAHSTHIYLAKGEQQQGVCSSEEHVRQPLLFEERGTGGMHGVSLAGSPS